VALAAAGQDKKIPSLAELERASAVIGDIHIRPQNIFDLDDPRENNRLFRFANLLHITTREEAVRRALLFKSGDRLSVRRIEETERVLRAGGYLYDVDIRPAAYEGGVVDIEVLTRDTWSLKPGLSVSREGGITSGSLSVEEENLLGTGASLSLTRRRQLERTGTEFQIANRHALGAWIGAEYTFSDLETRRGHAFAVAQPFYALDTRSAAGVSVSTRDNVVPVYRAGSVAGEYRERDDRLEAFRGWSAGLVGGRTHRLSAGASYRASDYALDSERRAPESLPEDVRLVGPFLRYEVLEDDYRKLQNFDLIERPEFFALGLQASLQVGRAMEALGSRRDATLYSLSVSDGSYNARRIVLASASASGRRDALAHRQQLGASLRYYARQARDATFFASLSGAVSKSPDISDVLQLGGDNGLRGYPLRYQTGDQRMLLTLEQRVYADWYPLQLFRVGGAIFYDVGRAWGGKFGQGEANPGWLSDFGFGLRILSTRSSFGNVIHMDLAFPLQTGPGIDPVQFVFKTRTSF